MNVSQGGDKGYGSSSDGGEEIGKIFGQVFPNQIPTSLPMKSIMTTSTKNTIPNVEFDMSKLQSKKGLNIIEKASGSSTAKPVATSDPKDKGKGVKVDTIQKENKKR